MHEDRGENDCVQRAKGEALYLPMCVHAVPVCMFQRANTPLSVRKIEWCWSLDRWWNRLPYHCWVTAYRCHTQQIRTHFAVQLPPWVSQGWNTSTRFQLKLFRWFRQNHHHHLNGTISNNDWKHLLWSRKRNTSNSCCELEHKCSWSVCKHKIHLW